MKINKQLFEDILSGKLRGTFVLKNGKKFNDRLLTDIYNTTAVVGKTTYYFNGKPIVSDYNGILDIVDFIPDTDMKENELTIEIPEGQEIDWQESAKQEKIVFKKKEISKPRSVPRSWEEYCKNNEDKQVWFVKENSNIGGCHLTCRPINEDKNTIPSKELAEAFRAMMQLMSLRHDWIHKWSIDNGLTEDWEPDWNGVKYHYCIVIFNNKYIVDSLSRFQQTLSFPTKEMAEDFMNCFEDLLEIAKPLI